MSFRIFFKIKSIYIFPIPGRQFQLLAICKQLSISSFYRVPVHSGICSVRNGCHHIYRAQPPFCRGIIPDRTNRYVIVESNGNFNVIHMINLFYTFPSTTFSQRCSRCNGSTSSETQTSLQTKQPVRRNNFFSFSSVMSQ